MRLLVIAALGAILLPTGASAEEPSGLARAAEGSRELVKGNLDGAVAILDEAQSSPDLPADRRAAVLNDRGVANWRLGRMKAAVTDFNEAAKLYPEFAAVYNNRGNVLLALGYAEEAIKDFDRAILLAPGYVAALNNRAIARIQLGRSDEAIADFGRAAELAPNSPAPLTGRGRAQLNLGRPYAALRDFSRALAVDPSFKSAYRNRAQARLALGHAAAAVEDLDNALAFAPDDPGLLLSRGRAFAEAANYPAAVRDLTRAVELDASNAQALVERGLVHVRLASYEAALADLGNAITIDHRLPLAYARRAYVHMKLGKPDAGLADVERALKLDPTSVEALEVRGLIHDALGQSEPAIRDLRQAVAGGRDTAEVWAALERLTGEPKPEPQEVAGAEFEDWHVMVDFAGRYAAYNRRFPKVKVPLEMIDDSAPRLLDWDSKRADFKGIGVLRYSAGKAPAASGPEELELVAIVDLYQNRTVGLEPYRQGPRLAAWTWLDGKLTVKGPDGVASDYVLRAQRRQGPAVASARQRQPSADPFETFLFGQSLKPKKQASVQSKTKKKKPKTLFELIFQ